MLWNHGPLNLLSRCDQENLLMLLYSFSCPAVYVVSGSLHTLSLSLLSLAFPVSVSASQSNFRWLKMFLARGSHLWTTLEADN